MTRWLALAAGLGTSLVAFSARATPAALFGTGPRGIALAGGGASLVLGPESVLVNPAALAATRAKTLLFGLRASDSALTLEHGGHTDSFPTELSKGLLIGVAAPLVRPSAEGWRAALGLFAETPPDFLVRAHLPIEDQPSFPLLVGRAGALDLGLGLGVGWGRVSVGAGVEVLAALSGRDVVAGAGGTPSGVGDELLPAWGPALGLLADLGPIGTLGVGFRSVLRADFDVNVAAANLSGIGIAPLNVQGIAHYEPLKVDAELSRPFGSWTLLAGARYERWSDFPGWLGRTVDCPAGVECGTPVPPAPGYVNVIVPRLGVERRFEGRALVVTGRAGYSFVPTPAPVQHGLANQLDASRHAMGLGYGVKLARLLPLELDGALRLDLAVPRTHDKEGAAAAAPLGPSVTTHAKIVTFSFGLRVEL